MADKKSAGAAPRYNVIYPENTWDEIAAGLWLGGTDETHDMNLLGHKPLAKGTVITKAEFDTVVTMYAWASPVDWHVKEIRFGVMDGDLSDIDTKLLHEIVVAAHTDWKAGKRVLVRCQAGINRSSLVAALVLIREGYSARKAIDLLRERRGQAVLSNRNFQQWLLDQNVAKWRR